MDFSYRGISAASMGVRVKDAPVPSRAAEKCEIQSIPGRQSPIYRRTGTFECYSLRIELTIFDNADVSAIYQWLSGSGRLVFDDMPDRYHQALSCDIISTRRVGAANNVRELTISMTVMPFAYAISNSAITTTSSPYSFLTLGTASSEPQITLHGVQSDVTITVNGVMLSITDLTGTVYIDVQARTVYQIEGTTKIFRLQNTTGRLWDMMLHPSTTVQNVVSWTGTVESVSIIKNERWL